MCLRLMKGMDISLSISESCLLVDEEVLQMNGAACDIFFLGLVVRDCEGCMQGVVNDAEAGSVVPVFSGIGAVSGLGYLNLADEG